MGRTGPPAGDTDAARQERHVAAVKRLQASYAAIPSGETVRLAKKTSNLFRPRAAQQHGLDVSGLDGVISVDRERRTADVQGMCTYEHLVDATLPHGLVPMVVPQLRTITLGGAVTGLGIESTSFRSGLPHESVLEMDVLTGAGQVVTTKPGDELFDAFPNSYGSLGYATRLRIELEQVPPYVALRHVPFADARALADALSGIVEDRTWQGERVDAVDGVAFAPGELYLTLARWTDEPGPTSDYAGQQVFYRSIRGRTTDRLTMNDYLWRWDTDWFWCSRGASGRDGCGARTSTGSSSRSTAAWASPTGSTGARDVPRGSGSCRTSRSPSSGWPSSWPGSTGRSACAPCGCARCGCAAART